MRAGWAVSVVFLAACPGPHSSDDPDGNTTGSDTMGDGGANWQMLIQRPWTALAGTEEWDCRRQLITEDTYISGFRGLAPPGTHHTLLTIDPNGPQTGPNIGNYDCNSSFIVDSEPLLYAGGLGTDDFAFPPGVAIKIPAGTYLQLYLHIFNTSDQDVTDSSGVEIQTVPAADVVHEADMFFVGKRTFTIPAMTPAQDYPVVTDCSATVDWHILGMWPHMHSVATHQKIEVTRAGVTRMTPLDVPFDFNEQRNYKMDFVVPVNDRLSVTCTYFNDTGAAVTAGAGANTEMCYAGAYVWPKVDDLYRCVNP